jgi:hypothetical protein
MIDLSDYTLLRKDILVKMIPKTTVQNSLIFTKESIDNSNLQYFSVLKVADAVVDVKVGDTILVNWKNVTPPFESMFDGSRGDYGITDETQVEAIVS